MPLMNQSSQMTEDQIQLSSNQINTNDSSNANGETKLDRVNSIG